MTTTITQLFAPQQLPAAAGVLFTMPTSPTTSILKNGRVRLTNTIGAAVTASLYADAAGNASGAGNCFLNAPSLGAGASLEVDLPVLKAGDTLRGVASAATSITCHAMDGTIFSS